MGNALDFKEYDCWLQKRLVDKSVFGEMPENVFIEAGNEIMLQAAEELREGIVKNYGFSPAVYYINSKSDLDLLKGKSSRIILGTAAFFNSVCNINIPQQKPEGFFIKCAKGEVYIAGQDQVGTLYGALRFLLLLVQGKLHDGFEYSDAPSAKIRFINHWDNTSGGFRMGHAGDSIFWKNDRLFYDPRRIKDYARLLASVGINRLSLNNVNVSAGGRWLYTEEGLKEAAKVAAILRPFGIRLFISVNFASPMYIGGLDTADPLDPKVRAWWKDRANLIYGYLPDIAGFLIKADSEGEPGPFLYKRTQAEGANVLAEALAPHGGEVVWRCFVYNCQQDWRVHSVDRARAAYDYFKPLDGLFADNVILQIKFGPYDFQVREPVSPLFGALEKTRYILELQVTQEYTGQQIDLCYLPIIWEGIMNFDTAHGPSSTLKELMTSDHMAGIAAVGQIGLDQNWTGHTLAQANFYGFGRIAWNGGLSAEEIAREWTVLSFGDPEIANTIKDMLMKSYETYQKYCDPYGITFMVSPDGHYGPSIEGYEFDRWGTYHRADMNAIGIDRTAAGTGYTEQYSKKNAEIFADPARCPENLLLFFHRIRYDYIMKNGETLLQNIYNDHFEGYEEVEKMIAAWKGLNGKIPEEVFTLVLSRMEKQEHNAREWRDQINTYFHRKTGIEDKKGRKIYE